MARRLNTRLLGRVALFLGVPFAIALYVLVKVVMPYSGDPNRLFEDAKRNYDKQEYVQAWISIRNAAKAGGGNRADVQFLTAQIALRQNPPAVREAIAALRTTLTLKPDLVEARRTLVEVYLAIRYWKEARDEIERLLKLDPAFGQAYVWGAFVEMALAENERGETRQQPYYQAAVARCQAGIEKDPNLLGLYRLQAQVYERMNQSEKAEEVINRAMANNPTVADAYILKATRLLAANKPDEADAVLKKGVEKAPPSPRLYVAIGEVAVRKGKMEEARDCFTKAVAADPNDEGGYLRLAGMNRMENRRTEAIATLDKGLAQLPNSVPLLAEEADLYLELADNKKADALVARIEKIMPKSPVVAYLKGKRALLGHQIRQAITLLEQIPEKQATPQSRLLLGRAYMLADELGSAQTTLESLVAEVPRMIPGWRALAEVQFRLREFDKAGRSAGVVLRASPDDIGMRLLLARTLVAQQRLPDALREAQAAAAQAKDDPDPYLLMAQIFQMPQVNRLTDAETKYRQALGLGKELVRVYQQFARFYGGTNQSAKLTALLEEAEKALSPSDFISVVPNLEKVEKELLRRLANDPPSVLNMLSLARLYQLTDRTEPALDILDKALAKATVGSAEWREAWQQLFLISLSIDRYEKAAGLVDQIRRVDPAAPELLFAGALIDLKQDKVAEAADQLREVSQAYRSMSQAHYMFGQVLVRLRRYDEAITALSRALETKPNLLPARLLLARIYYSQGNYAGAVDEANGALRFNPLFVPALETKAMAHAGMAQWAEALAAREEIARIVPDNVNNLVSLASLCLQRHDAKKAGETFSRAYAMAPDNALLVRAFADFYAETFQPQEGERIVDAYVARHKDESNAWVVRGEFTATVVGPDEAERYFRKAAELAPEDPYPLVFLGDQFSRSGNWTRAEAVYLEAIERAKQSKDNTSKKRLADVYMLHNKLGDAKAVIDAVLKNDPKDAAAMVVAGRIASRQDREADAKRYMEQAIAMRPDYGEAKVRLAELYAAPDPMQALELLAAVDPTDPSFEKAMLLRADINKRRPVLSEAILDLRRLMDFRPLSIAGRMALATLYVAVQEPGKAADLLVQLSKDRSDKDPGLLVGIGDTLMRQEKYRDALAAYEKARALAPELPDALIGEARCLVLLNQVNVALDRVHNVMNTYSSEVWPRMALVAIYERTNQPDKALEALQTALLRRPDWESGYVYLADLLLMRLQRPPEEARQWLQTGLAKVPKSIPLRAGLAAIDIGAQRPDLAVQTLKPLAEEFDSLYGRSPEKVERLRPYMPSIRIYSLALYNQGNINESYKWGMKLYTVDPTDVANVNNMAWILATEYKRLPEAREMIDRCKRLVPNHPQVLDTSGWIYFLSGRYDEAREDLQASIKYGDNAEAHYHLGCVFEAQDRPEEARAEFQKAFSMGLKGKDAEDLQKRLKRLPASPQ